jgi:hypothetical protein
MDRLKYRWGWWLGLSLTLLICAPARAADPAVTLTGPTGVINVDQVVPVEIRLDSGGQKINAADLTFSYPVDHWQVEAIHQEQSIFTLWPVSPVWNNQTGRIQLIGGRPNGVTAQSAPVVTVYLSAIKPGSSSIELIAADSRMYLNDGFGTAVNLSPTKLELTAHDTLATGFKLSTTTTPVPGTWSNRAVVTINWVVATGDQYSFQWSTDPVLVPDDQPDPTTGQVSYDEVVDGRYFFTIKNRPAGGTWSTVSTFRFLIDRTPPQPFRITPLDPRAIGQREAISWTTSDVTSGLDHATVAVNGRVVEPAAKSPLTVRPDWRGKTIMVTVYDAAGNSSSARWAAAGTRHSWWLITGVGVMVVIIFVLLGWLIYRRRQQTVI